MNKLLVPFLITSLLLIIGACSQEPPPDSTIKSIIADSRSSRDKGYHYGLTLGFGYIEELENWLIFEGESGEDKAEEEEALWDWLKKKRYIKKENFIFMEDYVLTRQGLDFMKNCDSVFENFLYSGTAEIDGISVKQMARFFCFLKEGEPEIQSVTKIAHNKYEVNYKHKLNRVNCSYAQDLKNVIKPKDEGSYIDRSITIKWDDGKWQKTGKIRRKHG